jgi:PKD domain
MMIKRIFSNASLYRPDLQLSLWKQGAFLMLLALLAFALGIQPVHANGFLQILAATPIGSGAEVNSQIELFFDQGIDPATFSGSIDGAPIDPAWVSTNVGATVLTIAPGPLTYGHTYFVVIDHSLATPGPDPLTLGSDYTFSFTVNGTPPPPLPSSFHGEIHIIDNPPVITDPVQIFAPDVSGADATALIDAYESNLVYAVNVPGDIQVTPDKEGGAENDPLTFMINGRIVGKANWRSGTSELFNLHPPQALPGGPYAGDEATGILFWGSSNDWGNDAVTYQWDFNNDGIYEETGQVMSWAWMADGPHTVVLKVTDAHGGEGTAAVGVTVNNVPPVVYAGSGPYSGSEGTPINFSGTAFDIADDPLTYEWDFDYDGITFNVDAGGSLTASHTYADNGSYTVALRVRDDHATVIAVQPVDVENVAPTAIFNHPGVDEGSDIALSLTAPSDPGSVDTATGFTYAFDCGSGYADWSTTSTTACPTADKGTRSVKGKIRDKDGGFTEYAATVTINDVLPASVNAGGPYNGISGQAVAINGSAVCAAVDTCTYAWDLDGDTFFDDATGTSTNYIWYAIEDTSISLKVTDSDGNSVTGTAIVHITAATHSIALVLGWNLVSFNLHPVNTDTAAVLSDISGHFNLVYGWDASGTSIDNGNWMKYAPPPAPPYPNTLHTLDERMGFWIYMTAGDTLDVYGSAPASSVIPLLDNVGGWNLVGYPSIADRVLPAALRDHGIGDLFTLIIAYHANDPIGDPWKLFDPLAYPYANDLKSLTPGWGYWIRVTADASWTLDYLADPVLP